MTSANPTDTPPLLQAILNLSKFHREHEKFYTSAPRELAVHLQRHARTRWRTFRQRVTTLSSTTNTDTPA